MVISLPSIKNYKNKKDVSAGEIRGFMIPLVYGADYKSYKVRVKSYIFIKEELVNWYNTFGLS